MVELSCTVCKTPYNGPSERYVCENCGASIEPVLAYHDAHAALLKNGACVQDGIWQYRSFYPGFSQIEPISIGEGGTPLQRAESFEKEYGLSRFYLKNETLNPTGSYKDRFSTLALSLFHAERVQAVAIGSAGNAGASVAAYSTKAAIPCYVILPEGGVFARAQQAMSYGARFIRARGEVDDCIALVEQGVAAYGWRNGCTTMLHNPLASEGYKSIVYELYQQLGGTLPDAIVCPIGGGILISKVYRACLELLALGLVDVIPRLVGVQAEGCQPVVWALAHEEQTTPVWKNPKTIAGSINDPVTFEGKTALHTIRASNGTAVAISDEDIIDAMRVCAAREAVLAEPASAAAVAAVKVLLQTGWLSPDASVVSVVTGNALRDLPLFGGDLSSIPVVRADHPEDMKKALMRYIET